MERTKEYSVVNDTLKALKNQGLSERYFQKGHSFSSADPSATWVHLHTDREYYICCADKGQFFFCRIMKLAIDEEGILYYDIEVRFFADTESDYDK